MFQFKLRPAILAVAAQFFCLALFAQNMKWAADGQSYFTKEEGEIVKYEMPGRSRTTVVSKADLTPAGQSEALPVDNFEFTENTGKVLIYTNSKRVWRQKTRGDYWLLDLQSKSLQQLGRGRPASSLMFAKLSPDGLWAAYVSERNVYVEELSSGAIKKLTDTKGTKKLINGTFDWVYEEEFLCRDGFRWSPDSKRIAYWQIDANQIRDFYMVNNTDSIYSRIIPVEYPKVGFPPSPARVGAVDISSGKTQWMDVPGDPQQHYIIRMEWTPDGRSIILQQLNRKQNQSLLMLCNPKTGTAKTVYKEKDEAWVSTVSEWANSAVGWDWINKGKDFVWLSEKDGWRHLYRVSVDGKNEKLLTPGKQDVVSVELIDDKNKVIYYISTPANKATQRYLYRVGLDGREPPKMLSPVSMSGSHSYAISPTGEYAKWRFSNYFTQPMTAWVTLPDHKPLKGEDNLKKKYDPSQREAANVEYFKVKTEDGVEMDAWMRKPNNFDESKKYPIIFYFYGEPAGTTVRDAWGNASNFIYDGDLAQDGYITVSLDNRGTPAPKGRAWRKAIYRNIGQVNIRDQAMGAKEIIKRPYVDPERVGVWGWSGGGSSTLNCMFQYPDIFTVGVAIAPVTSSLFYDNIYTERYMGLPQENMGDYLAGAAITHAKNLKGKLLLVHGTTDDNVHFQNSEALVNELVKHNKQFQYMAYPGRSHSLVEGEGTFRHLSTMVSAFMRANCPPGAR
ncbi:MAG TPA: S9 family peptidase [Bacteroidetes bacterium]|nr:S9 family peptidase [Bacteroidota bacterium]